MIQIRSFRVLRCANCGCSAPDACTAYQDLGSSKKDQGSNKTCTVRSVLWKIASSFLKTPSDLRVQIGWSEVYQLRIKSLFFPGEDQ